MTTGPGKEERSYRRNHSFQRYRHADMESRLGSQLGPREGTSAPGAPSLVIRSLSVLAILCLAVPAVFAQDVDTEWAALTKDFMELYRAGKYDRAVDPAKKALDLAEKKVGPDHPLVAVSLNNLATIYRVQGQSARAELLFERALAISEKALGPDHPQVAQILSNLAALYRETGRDEEAKVLETRAAGIRAIPR